LLEVNEDYKFITAVIARSEQKYLHLV